MASRWSRYKLKWSSGSYPSSSPCVWSIHSNLNTSMSTYPQIRIFLYQMWSIQLHPANGVLLCGSLEAKPTLCLTKPAGTPPFIYELIPQHQNMQSVVFRSIASLESLHSDTPFDQSSSSCWTFLPQRPLGAEWSQRNKNDKVKGDECLDDGLVSLEMFYLIFSTILE